MTKIGLQRSGQNQWEEKSVQRTVVLRFLKKISISMIQKPLKAEFLLFFYKRRVISSLEKTGSTHYVKGRFHDKTDIWGAEASGTATLTWCVHVFYLYTQQKKITRMVQLKPALSFVWGYNPVNQHHRNLSMQIEFGLKFQNNLYYHN